MNTGDTKQGEQDKEQGAPEPKQGGVQIAIGIIAGILILFNPGTGLMKLHADYSITQNQTLLIELGYDPTDFQYNPSYWIGRVAFHVFGFAAILLYVISVATKKLPAATVTLLLCLAYLLAHAYGNITSLSYEEQVRGLTAGGWAGKIVSWLPKYAIELALLVQGLLGVRKRVRARPQT